jgi:hypothetical protein
MNPHGADGTLLTDGQVDVVEMEPTKYLADEQAAAAERFMADVNDLDDELDQGLADVRPTTEQRCEECGFKTAYYWTRQVSGAVLSRAAGLRSSLLARTARPCAQVAGSTPCPCNRLVAHGATVAPRR